LFVLESLLNPIERVKRLLKEFFLNRANLPAIFTKTQNYTNILLLQPLITHKLLALSIHSCFMFVIA